GRFGGIERSGLDFSHGSICGFGGRGAGSGLIPIVLTERHLVLDIDLRLVSRGAFVDLGIDQRERNLGHTRGLAFATAGKDHILHARATQALGGLFAQHPGDGVGDIGLPTTIGAHHRGNTFTRKLQFGPVTEGLESKDLQPLQFEQRPTPSGMANRNPARGRAVLNICLTSAGTTPANVPRELTGVKHKAHKMLWITRSDRTMSHPGCKTSRHSSACKAWMRWRGESLES